MAKNNILAEAFNEIFKMVELTEEEYQKIAETILKQARESINVYQHNIYITFQGDDVPIMKLKSIDFTEYSNDQFDINVDQSSLNLGLLRLTIKRK